MKTTNVLDIGGLPSVARLGVNATAEYIIAIHQRRQDYLGCSSTTCSSSVSLYIYNKHMHTHNYMYAYYIYIIILLYYLSFWLMMTYDYFSRVPIHPHGPPRPWHLRLHKDQGRGLDFTVLAPRNPRKIRDVAVGWDAPTAATPWLLSGCRWIEMDN